MAVEITESVIEEIKARVDLAELISSYGIQVKHAGSSMKACCPFHHEKTPSFNINPNRGFYHCFGCGESGDAIKFVQKMDGLTFVEAAKKLADQCGIKIEEKEDPTAGKRKRLYTLMLELAQFYNRCLSHSSGKLAVEYLAKRNLGKEVQDDFLIGYAPEGVAPILKWAEKRQYTEEELELAGVIKRGTRPGDRGYHRFGGRLMFSIKDKQGRVVAFSGRQLVEKKNSGKYVNSPETLIFKKSNVLFGFDRAARNIANSPHREVICCEGQIDTIRLHINGFTTAVASQGTAFTEEHAKMIKRVADSAVLMYDDDGAGHKATIKVAGMLLAMEMPVRVVSLPDGDDPDSFLRKHSADELQARIDRAESIVSFQCRIERAKEKNPESIDAVARVSKAVLTTLAACPSAILRASLVGEASKLLGIPSVALNDELARTKPAPSEPSPVRNEEPVWESDPFEAGESMDEPVAGVPEQSVEPPPARERALMEFLMANEYAQELDGMVGEFLPAKVFSHDFTARFVVAWREEVAAGDDRFAAFAETLSSAEQPWLDAVLLEAGKIQACGLQPTEILQDFVRLLWIDWLKRARGSLPADGGAEVDFRRVKISMDLKRLQQVKWNTVKEMVREFMKGEQ